MTSWLESIKKQVQPGAKYASWYPLYEAIDTIFYTPSKTTHGSSHIRDGVDLKRIMITVWLCTFPVIFFGSYNVGFQAFGAIATQQGAAISDWHMTLATLFNMGAIDFSQNWDRLAYGLAFFVPLYLVVFVVGGIWEVVFAMKRKHEINEGFFVTSILFTLTLPPTTPLWMAALGISFGVVIGKEVFGGTGKNFLNPALVGRAFLYFAYPAAMSGDKVWIAVAPLVSITGEGGVSGLVSDAYSGATILAVAATSGIEGAMQAGFTWWDAFVGFVPGSLGETSVICIVIGAFGLLYTKIASWRIMLGCVIGVAVASYFSNFIATFGFANPMLSMPFHWHLVTGGFAFACVFMATDPVSAAMTNTGRLYFGLLIGVMTVLIRVYNPAYPEGAMLAVLFANMVAPSIDYLVLTSNIKRRIRRTQ